MITTDSNEGASDALHNSPPTDSRNDTYWVLGQRVRLVTLNEDVRGAYCLVDIQSPPGSSGPPPHAHLDCDETFYVLDGALDVMIDGTWRTLNVGHHAIARIGMVHTFRNTTERSTRFMSGFSPGLFERFFRDHGLRVLDAELDPPPVSPEAISRVLATAGEYGMVMHGGPDVSRKR